MTRERYTLRTFPAGAPASGLTYFIKLHADDSTLATGTTDASGQVTYTPDLSPGPHYFTGTDTAPTPDSVRVVSSKTMGSGGSYSLGELPFALRALGTGVTRGYANACAVTYDGAGLDLDTNTGAMLALGIPAVIYTSVHQSVTNTRDATNPRQCYWVAEFTGVGQTNEGKVVLKDVCGTAAASPSLPALTQTEATWQLPLATFRLPNTGSTTLTQVTDVRTYLATRNPVLSDVKSRTDPASVATTTSTTLTNPTTLNTSLTLLSGVTYDINIRGFLTCKISAAPFEAQMSVYVGNPATPANVAPFIGTTSTGYIGLANAHNVTVVGTGAAVTCSMAIKVTGGTMSYTTGVLDVTAVPRT